MYFENGHDFADEKAISLYFLMRYGPNTQELWSKSKGSAIESLGSIDIPGWFFYKRHFPEGKNSGESSEKIKCIPLVLRVLTPMNI